MGKTILVGMIKNKCLCFIYYANIEISNRDKMEDFYTIINTAHKTFAILTMLFSNFYFRKCIKKKKTGRRKED